MKKVIVTGAGGQLGLTLMESASTHDNLYVESKTADELNITSLESIQKALKNGNYDFCINCAAYTNVEQSEKTPDIAFKVNAEGAKNLALCCKENDTALIHISSDYVFDGTKSGPYTIYDPTNPINEYGKSKLKGEQYIRQIWDNHFIIRTSWLYSKKYGQNFYRTIVQKAKEGLELRVTDAQIGCPTNTESLAKFILGEVLQGNHAYGTYHFTDRKPMTWYKFAQQILEENSLMGNANLVLDRNYRTFAKRPKNSVLS
ncbi:dTDP-4-dehydrorhamnose reductase [Muricauda sp. ANG21]|uniref:dTDP-4-dehydrorhamnose reductase n=1 Tax=Allomuricauda sp. ANG21 TaxID=3042468 RepID=UPI0034535CB4